MLLFLPGLVAARLLRAPWLPAIALAPALSTTAVVLLTVTSSALGVPWGPVPLFAGALAVWLMAAAVGALLLRYTTPEEPSRLPFAALVVTAIAAVAVGLVLISMSHTPEAFPQHPDTIFHLGATQWMVEHQDASFLHAEAFRRLPGAGPYQAAFHAMVATITELTGASVVVSVSSFVLVITGVVWPLGCILLARTLLGPDLAVTLSAGVVSVGFSAYPFMLMGYGPYWPSLFGYTLLPGALALAAVMMPSAHQRPPPLTSRLRAMVLLLATLQALLVAHPNALVTLLIFSSLMAAGVILRKGWETRRGRPGLAAGLVAGLVVATGLAFLATTVLGAKGGSMRRFGTPGPELPAHVAAYDMLLFARHGAGALWVLAALVAAGSVIVLVRHRGQWWLVAALVITKAVLYLNVAVDSPTVRLLTWPWNNEAVRLAPIVVLPAVLLATVAMAAAARLLTTRLRLRPWQAAVAVPLLFVVATGGGYVQTHRRALDPYFNPDPAHSWASNRELLALRSLARHVPAGAVVAENPWNGGSYMYIVSGRYMLFPTEKDLAGADRTLLARSLDDVGSSPTVCAAARRESVRFAITGGRPFSNAGTRATAYAGVDAVGSSDAFRKIARDGPYTLYRMVRCAKS